MTECRTAAGLITSRAASPQKSSVLYHISTLCNTRDYSLSERCSVLDAIVFSASARSLAFSTACIAARLTSAAGVVDPRYQVCLVDNVPLLLLFRRLLRRCPVIHVELRSRLQ